MAQMIRVRVVDFEQLGILGPSFGGSAIREARQDRRQARRGKRKAKRLERIEDDTREARKERKAAQKRRASSGRGGRRGAEPERVPVTPRDLSDGAGGPGRRAAQGPLAQRPDWERPWSPLGPRQAVDELPEDEGLSDEELLADEHLTDEELLEEDQGTDEFQGLPAWGAKLPLGKHLRIQPKRGHRVAVMEYRPGLYLVAEVPEKVARAEEKRAKYGLLPLLPSLLTSAVTTAIQRGRANQQATVTPPATPTPAPGPQGLRSVPVVSGMRPPVPEVYTSLGWADYGCDACGGGCGQRTRSRR